jgi:anti-sigma factor RsiW
MTDCPNGELRDLLPDLLHDRLSPVERAAVQAHVDGCAECRAELALLLEMRAALGRTPALDVGRIAAAIPPASAPHGRARRSWAGWRVAAAITILAAGGTSVAVVQHGRGVGRGSTRATPAAAALPNGAAPIANEPQTTGEGALPAAGARAPAAHRELALGTSAVTDLSDRELSSLLRDIGTLDAIPAADVDSASMSPVAPRGRGE